jgi:hypothetical protein
VQGNGLVQVAVEELAVAQPLLLEEGDATLPLAAVGLDPPLVLAVGAAENAALRDGDHEKARELIDHLEESDGEDGDESAKPYGEINNAGASKSTAPAPPTAT